MSFDLFTLPIEICLSTGCVPLAVHTQPAQPCIFYVASLHRAQSRHNYVIMVGFGDTNGRACHVEWEPLGNTCIHTYTYIYIPSTRSLSTVHCSLSTVHCPLSTVQAGAEAEADERRAVGGSWRAIKYVLLRAIFGHWLYNNCNTYSIDVQLFSLKRSLNMLKLRMSYT